MKSSEAEEEGTLPLRRAPALQWQIIIDVQLRGERISCEQLATARVTSGVRSRVDAIGARCSPRICRTATRQTAAEAGREGRKRRKTKRAEPAANCGSRVG